MRSRSWPLDAAACLHGLHAKCGGEMALASARQAEEVNPRRHSNPCSRRSNSNTTCYGAMLDEPLKTCSFSPRAHSKRRISVLMNFVRTGGGE
jgi:hypothetical protein